MKCIDGQMKGHFSCHSTNESECKSNRLHFNRIEQFLTCLKCQKKMDREHFSGKMCDINIMEQ